MSEWNLPDPTHEPSKVLIKKHTFVDSVRDNREVPIKIYYPSDDDLQNLPVIFWSHGLGGGADGAGFISRYLASNGYVLVHVQHRGTDTTLWEGKEGHPWDIIRATHIPRTATLNRFLDIPFVLDALPAWLEGEGELATLMDLNNLGLSGHSFGALTTQVIAGQLFPDEDENLRQYKDDRFKAGILYSPVPIAHLSDEDPVKLYGPISIPLLHMTGTEDRSPISGEGHEKRLVIKDHAGHQEQFTHILEGGDHMIYNGSRGKLGSAANREAHENEIKQTVLTYWNAMLKGDAAAKEWLTKAL